ncbi:COG4315 family predicted lipoprotein [Loktanella sp. Alg231-35]|uniref:COG4315 family predicted lipoprotein n=1 Tax=Loktanella sp. Alg231-35 TaxID=1922220 RepID=UPI001F3A5CDD|nr:hypothetical protein [Loktanella sp. Alg231-35]
MKMIAAITLALLVAASGKAFAQSYGYSYDKTPQGVTLAAGHGPLTDANGMTLFTFDNDSAGQSNCYDSCAASWPPYLVDAGQKAPGAGFTQIERTDGMAQWAKDGAPLYLWVGDAAPGDATGDGVGGVWHIAN